MADWLDLAAQTSEAATTQRIEELSKAEVAELTADLLKFFRIPDGEVDKYLLRLLLDRARPFVLPKSVWSRRVGSSTNIQGVIGKHVSDLGFEPTDDRLVMLQTLYRAFAEERKRQLPLTERLLNLSGFRCRLCGYAFRNEDLEATGIISPHGFSDNRSDAYKPHYHIDKGNSPFMPTVDHLWPISLYGSNDPSNLAVLCQGCNNGKSDFLNFRQTRPFNGLPFRNEILSESSIRLQTFYVQLSRQPVCYRSGRGPSEVELTIRPVNMNFPMVLDNLQTVSMDAD